ncbi:YcdB/YcdC domain-containing protein [Paenibacillus hamazuiensis]|uniref:YcdB/YcdC domain-containing protein n=1 Tax=Paenibacillus hamazuiensis TaxID=2936508 RepID=UPI002010B763|nr:hypothetical protein [Paenibacillus hamazuiensis]
MKKSLPLSLSLAAALCAGSLASADAPAFAAGPQPAAPLADDVRAALRPSGQLTLLGSEQLYNRPDADSGTGLLLSPQTVAPLGFSAQTGFYLISTWLGDKWIRPSQGVLEGLEPVEMTLVPDSPVYLFDAPLLGLNSGQTASGPLLAFEKWRSWYHVRTDQGDKWIHFAYSLPANLRPSAKPLELPDGATLFKYPYGLSGEVGVIGPQTVTPVEQGDEWAHLRGDFGDGWVHFQPSENDPQASGDDDGVPVGKTKAIELARQRLGLSGEYTLEAAHLIRLGDGPKRWSLQFRKQQGDHVAGSADVTLNASDGTIDWFTKNETVSVPGISEKTQDRAALKQLVDGVVAKVSPAADAGWMIDETPGNPLQNRRYRMDPSLTFRYVRTVNGLPYPDNNITVNVSPSQNDVSYYMAWNDNKRFDAPEGLMPQEKAELAFADAFLDKAVYMAPQASRDALTPMYAVVPRLYDTLAAKDGQWRSSSGDMEPRGPVTAQPLAAMPAENLNLSLEQAADIARKKLNLPETARPEHVLQNNSSWVFQLNVPAQAADQSRTYYVEVSSVTGDIVQCSTQADNDGSFIWLTVPYISEAQAEVEAERLLRLLLPAYTHQLYMIRSELWLTDGITVSTPEYRFTYRRRIDGIWADRQELTVSVSPVSGQWIRLQSQLTPGIYPQSKPAFISEEEVRKLMLSRYRVEACYMADDVLLTNPSTSIRYRLVPTAESAYTSLLDAQTGVWRDFYTMEPEQPANK